MTKRKIAYKGKKSGYKLNEKSKELKETNELLLEIKELILKNEEEEQVQEEKISEETKVEEKKEKNCFKRVIKNIRTRLDNEKGQAVLFNLFIFLFLGLGNIFIIFQIVLEKMSVFKPYEINLVEDIGSALVSLAILITFNYTIVFLANKYAKKYLFENVSLQEIDFEPYVLILNTLFLVITTVYVTNNNIKEFTSNAEIYKKDKEGEIIKENKTDNKVFGVGRSIKEIVYIPVFKENYTDKEYEDIIKKAENKVKENDTTFSNYLINLIQEDLEGKKITKKEFEKIIKKENNDNIESDMTFSNYLVNLLQNDLLKEKKDKESKQIDYYKAEEHFKILFTDKKREPVYVEDVSDYVFMEESRSNVLAMEYVIMVSALSILPVNVAMKFTFRKEEN